MGTGRHTSTESEQTRAEKRDTLSRQFVPLGSSIIAGAGAFAAVAAGWAKFGQVGNLQFALAAIASVTTGTFTYVEARKRVIENQQRSKNVISSDLELPSLAGPMSPERPPGHGTLFQLPPDIADFTGRDDALLQMHELLERNQSDQFSPMVITMIAGQGGVGKTALAVHVAYELRARFPDGQLYVNLRGVEAQALDPIDVLADFLRALGVDGAAIPQDLEERAKLYRARLANLRILVLLDNAASERQVRPLLPGSATCATLITSRIHLTGIEAGRSINLDVLSPGQAVELFGKVAGRERVVAEPEAAQTIAQLCGYLPLAVRIAGAKLAAKPHWRLAVFAERLIDERRRLDELTAGDLEVRTSFELSYKGRKEEERRAFRLLGLLKAADFSAWVVSALDNCDLRGADDVVERLVDARLLEIAGTDPRGRTRYRLHDLLRVFARERLDQEETWAAQQAALKRVLGAYLSLTYEADRMLSPDTFPPVNEVVVERWRPVNFHYAPEIIHDDPLDWFGAEQANLIATVEQAYRAQLWELTWSLTYTVPSFFELPARWDDLRYLAILARRAARRAHDRRQEAIARRLLGVFSREVRRWDDAVACFDRSLSVFRELADHRQEALTLKNFGALHWLQGLLADSQAHFDEAVAYYEACLPILREVGDEIEEAKAWRGLGAVFREQRRLDDAIACYQKCLPVFRKRRHLRYHAFALVGLSEIYRDQGRWDDAIACLDECLPIYRQLVHPRGEAQALLGFGEVYIAQARWKSALPYLQESVKIFHRIGDRFWEARALKSLAGVLRSRGDQRAADEALRLALDIVSGLGTDRTKGSRQHEAGMAHS